MKRTVSLILAAAVALPFALGPVHAAPVAKNEAEACASIDAGKTKTVDCETTGSIETGARADHDASRLYPAGPVNAGNGIWF